MAFFPKQSGTTEQSFIIGAGSGKHQFTIDALHLLADHTWIIPDSDGGEGYSLTTDGRGRLSWTNISGGGSNGGFVPYYIPAGDTFTVPLYKQALFTMPIEMETGGNMDITGYLVEVD